MRDSKELEYLRVWVPGSRLPMNNLVFTILPGVVIVSVCIYVLRRKIESICSMGGKIARRNKPKRAEMISVFTRSTDTETESNVDCDHNQTSREEEERDEMRWQHENKDSKHDNRAETIHKIEEEWTTDQRGNVFHEDKSMISCEDIDWAYVAHDSRSDGVHHRSSTDRRRSRTRWANEKNERKGVRIQFGAKRKREECAN